MDENILTQMGPSFTLYAQKAKLMLTGDGELLSAGMAGTAEVQFEFSADWDGLQKTAVFTNGIRTVKVDETHWDDGVCVIPAEVLSAPGKTVMVGVYGSNGLHLTLPTVWCVLGRVEPSPDLSGEPVNPGPALSALERRIQALESSAGGLVPRELQAGKTDAMTQAVGIDASGKLWALPAGKVMTLAATVLSGTYSFYGADFDFSSADDIMERAEAGEQVRLAIMGTNDVYLLSHMHGAESTARMYFTGITWGTGMTMPTVDVFEVDHRMEITRVSCVELASLGTYSKPAGGIPSADLSQNVLNGLSFPITVTENAGTITVDKTIAQICAAIQAGKSCPVIVDGTNCGWVQYADSSEAALCFILSYDTPPTLYTVHMTGSGVTLEDTSLNVLDKISINQGAGNAGKFLVVGSDGNVAPVAISAWTGGNF